VKARIVSFEAEPGLKPKWKTCGTALPGYGAGWFRLYNKSKALIFLSDKKEAVYIPTRKDFSVLLSAENNPVLLEALQQRGKM
ncbi:MAG: PH domain-containing protein, partial [Verrucomicrobiota bacterium]